MEIQTHTYYATHEGGTKDYAVIKVRCIDANFGAFITLFGAIGKTHQGEVVRVEDGRTSDRVDNIVRQKSRRGYNFKTEVPTPIDFAITERPINRTILEDSLLKFSLPFEIKINTLSKGMQRRIDEIVEELATSMELKTGSAPQPVKPGPAARTATELFDEYAPDSWGQF